MKNYDVIILGAGPAGLTAGLYTARNNLKTLIVDTNSVGGKLNSYISIENFPSHSGSSEDLVSKMTKQVEDLGVEIEEFAEVTDVDLYNKVVEVNGNSINSNSIIVATGSQPRKLGIEGEEEFSSKGVSYCATCDGPMFKDKTVAVIGGGNSALEEACFLTKFARKVYLLHRRDEFRADQIVQDEVRKNINIEVLFNTVPVRIEGDDKVRRLIVNQNDITRAMFVDGVFPFIGIVPNTEMFKDYKGFLDGAGFIRTNSFLETSVPNVYAVGDVRNTALRQVITATADGALAGYMCALENK